MKRMNKQARIGLLVLSLAIAVRAIGVRITGRVPEHLIDGGMGVLFGVAFGLLLLGLRRRRSPGC